MQQHYPIISLSSFYKSSKPANQNPPWLLSQSGTLEFISNHPMKIRLLLLPWKSDTGNNWQKALAKKADHILNIKKSLWIIKNYFPCSFLAFSYTQDPVVQRGKKKEEKKYRKQAKLLKYIQIPSHASNVISYFLLLTTIHMSVIC